MSDIDSTRELTSGVYSKPQVAHAEILNVELPTPQRPRSMRGVIGESPVMLQLFSMVDRVGRCESTVLITGESGTGKELVARAVHDASLRAAGPFVVVNCGAIPEALLESELFGHARGAFTGAHQTRLGRVAAAKGGTLFLDEIGELPLALQVKLLRLLQQHEYSPVGDTRTMAADVRIVAATNKDLEAEGRERNVSRGSLLSFECDSPSGACASRSERRRAVPCGALSGPGLQAHRS